MRIRTTVGAATAAALLVTPLAATSASAAKRIEIEDTLRHQGRHHAAIEIEDTLRTKGGHGTIEIEDTV